MTTKKLWQGLADDAQDALVMRDYGARNFSQQLAEVGIDAGKLVTADRKSSEVSDAWIPGVEVFSRTVFSQRHRGVFGEFVRRD